MLLAEPPRPCDLRVASASERLRRRRRDLWRRFTANAVGRQCGVSHDLFRLTPNSNAEMTRVHRGEVNVPFGVWARAKTTQQHETIPSGPHGIFTHGVQLAATSRHESVTPARV